MENVKRKDIIVLIHRQPAIISISLQGIGNLAKTWANQVLSHFTVHRHYGGSSYTLNQVFFGLLLFAFYEWLFLAFHRGFALRQDLRMISHLCR